MFLKKLSYICHAKSPQFCLTLRPNGLVAHQAPLFMGFPRQEYWSGFPCPSPGDLPDQGKESPSLQTDSFTH